jgi:DNA (cytosine-5)-methyltransferase 1
MAKKKFFTFIDLFAGVGGIRIPFEAAGGECVFTSEWDKFAQQTYISNFHDEVHGDITQVDETEIPTHDVILAGFPCQPFSNAGLKEGFNDTRGTLFFEIERIARYHEPKIMLLENVKGLVSHDKKRTFKVILERLDELGYWVEHKVLNARDFGVPQNRERIYIVAYSKEFFDEGDFSFPRPAKKNTRVGDVLDARVDAKYTISDRLWAGHQRRKLEHAAKGNGFGYSLFGVDSPYTSTISARYYKDGSEILIKQRGKNPRKVTPREAARLQGFPEWFRVHPSDTQAYKQFGNSVAVPVIDAIAKRIAKLLSTLE